MGDVEPVISGLDASWCEVFCENKTAQGRIFDFELLSLTAPLGLAGGNGH